MINVGLMLPHLPEIELVKTTRNCGVRNSQVLVCYVERGRHQWKGMN